MDNLLRCKACGYIIKEKKLGDVCPACGVPKKSFEPYKDNISKNRRFILEFNLHPIAVHFPQAIATLSTFFILIGIIIPAFRDDLFTTVKVLSLFLPLTVIAAIMSGLLDGKTKFKKITTPALVKKIIAGGVFLVLSIIISALVFSSGMDLFAYILVLYIGCLICQVALGEIGKKLMNSYLPG